MYWRITVIRYRPFPGSANGCVVTVFIKTRIWTKNSKKCIAFVTVLPIKIIINSNNNNNNKNTINN